MNYLSDSNCAEGKSSKAWAIGGIAGIAGLAILGLGYNRSVNADQVNLAYY